MNEAIVTQLKVIVERAVRPVRAAKSRKRKMREELLAHVTAVFETEATHGDAEAALDRTAARFGDPTALTAQLQQSVPWLERFVFGTKAGPDRLWRRTGESRLHCAFRQSWQMGVGLFMVTLIPACLLFLVLYAAIRDIRTPDLREIGLCLAGMAMGLGYSVAAICAAIFLAHGMWHALCEAPRSWRHIVPIGAAAMLTGASFPCFIALVDLLGTDSMVLSGTPRGVSLRPDFLATLVGLGVLSPYALVFGVNLRWRILNVRAGRPWPRTLLINLGAGTLLSSAAFALALIFSGDFSVGIDAATGPLLAIGFWLLPCDLCLSAPAVVARLQTDREWADLPIDGAKGAVA